MSILPHLSTVFCTMLLQMSDTTVRMMRVISAMCQCMQLLVVLEAGIVDQDVDPAPLVDSLLHNAPAEE